MYWEKQREREKEGKGIQVMLIWAYAFASVSRAEIKAILKYRGVGKARLNKR